MQHSKGTGDFFGLHSWLIHEGVNTLTERQRVLVLDILPGLKAGDSR
jgi:hypothetical protein